jgi:hypothetical protein
MQALKIVSLRPKTQTVSVYTRHSADCSKKDESQWRRCRCPKYLYLLRDGNDKTVSAKTRSWEKAEQQAQEIRESWDPVKQRRAKFPVVVLSSSVRSFLGAAES